MLVEQPTQVARADPQSVSEGVDPVLVHRALGDQMQGAVDGVGRAAPDRQPRRDLGPAAQARPEPHLVRRRGAGQEDAVLELGRARRADRTTEDAGGLHGGEEASVEARVAGEEGAIAGVTVEIEGAHGCNASSACRWLRPAVSAISTPSCASSQRLRSMPPP